jgi:phosphatidylinositol glycan class A protein
MMISYVRYSRGDVLDLIRSVGQAIHAVHMKKVTPMRQHAEVKAMYSWANVAARTELVSNKAV